MRTELETAVEVEAWLARHGHLEDVLIRDLDLRHLSDPLSEAFAYGSVLMGCVLGSGVGEGLAHRGAVIFPVVDGLPYHPYRQNMYSPDELMRGYQRGDADSFMRDTLDSRIYDHYQALKASDGAVPILQALSMRLHDHAMERAMKVWLAGDGAPQRVVGIMGGHAMRRGEAAYRDVAHLARSLGSRGYTVATGGGPGAMEAGNLGAWMAHHPPAALDEALHTLAVAQGWQDPAWFDTALVVRDRWPGGRPSLGVPTWFYGHEPTNLFASHVAKYFANSIREDGLLGIALHGVVYAPGSAGTVQEVFQDAAQNHYGTFEWVSPMVLMGVEYWTEHRPVVPLLSRLAEGKEYAAYLHVSDDVHDIADFIQAHPPAPWPQE